MSPGLRPAIFRETPENSGYLSFKVLKNCRPCRGTFGIGASIINVIGKLGASRRGPVNWPIYQFLDGWWTTPCRARKCIPRGYTAKGNCFLGRTKLSLGQLFPFLDHQLCLASLRSADNLLMIAESEKLSLGKFCSSSKTFLSSIPCRNIYSCHPSVSWGKIFRYSKLS